MNSTKPFRPGPNFRPAVELVSSKQTCQRMLEDKTKHHEGWSNSATWLFALYFGQERPNYEAICDLLKRPLRRTPTGPLHDSIYTRAHDLMRLVYRRGKMAAMDFDDEGNLDTEGRVNVREIVDYYAGELRSGKQEPTSKPKEGQKA